MKPILRNARSLTTIASRYARDRAAPVQTVIKEILHTEILYAMLQSNAMAGLAFQGGTCLRLCYGGRRYSEDLDFACLGDFNPTAVGVFVDALRTHIGTAYGLKVDVKDPHPSEPNSGVVVARWKARISIPMVDRSLPQSQVIHVEIADVPGRDVSLVPVVCDYPHMAAPMRGMLIPAESLQEIMADKIVALGARNYLKYRDVWDLNDLFSRGVAVDYPLVQMKLGDYDLDEADFQFGLQQRLADLQSADAVTQFQGEMSRFLDARVLNLVKGELARKLIETVVTRVRQSVPSLESKPVPP